MALAETIDSSRLFRGVRTGRINRKTVLFLASIVFVIAPKIDLITIFGGSGIRIEDSVLYVTLPFLFWRYRTQMAPIPSYVWAFWIFMGASVLSAVLNYGELGPRGLVYIARQIQYFLWFLIGVQFAPRVPEQLFRKAFGFIAVVLLLWWAAEATHLIPKIGRFTGAGQRATVNTSGPYETAVLVVFVALLAPRTWQKIGMVAILLATQSRITLVATVFVWLKARPGRNLVLSVPLVVIAALALAYMPSAVSNSRVVQTQSISAMFSELQSRLEFAPQIQSLEQYWSYDLKANVDYQGSDPSFQVRAFKWSMIVKSLGSNTLHLLFGWGPGAWGLAVDGHYVRFLGEGGLVGFFTAMIYFGTSLFARDTVPVYRLAFLTMAVTSLFIDAATSSKVMSVLWLIAGYFHGRTWFLARQSAPRGTEPLR